MSQEELAEAVGVATETISRYESGTIAPSLAILARVGRALDLPPSAFLPSEAEDAHEAELLDRWRLLDEDGQNVVTALLRRLGPPR